MKKIHVKTSHQEISLHYIDDPSSRFYHHGKKTSQNKSIKAYTNKVVNMKCDMP